ncbi:MAG: DUF6379 domain-containing protein [Bacteroidales bacterium]
MLEFPNIQSRGFRNLKEGESTVGFQVPVKLTYYRGLWLPMLRPATVTVDEERFEGEAVTWVIDGVSYRQDELNDHPDVHWSCLEPAILRIRKPGGLPLGIHDVMVQFHFSASYMPPRLDLAFTMEPYRRRMVLVR